MLRFSQIILKKMSQISTRFFWKSTILFVIVSRTLKFKLKSLYLKKIRTKELKNSKKSKAKKLKKKNENFEKNDENRQKKKQKI